MSFVSKSFFSFLLFVWVCGARGLKVVDILILGDYSLVVSFN